MKISLDLCTRSHENTVRDIKCRLWGGEESGRESWKNLGGVVEDEIELARKRSRRKVIRVANADMQQCEKTWPMELRLHGEKRKKGKQ